MKNVFFLMILLVLSFQVRSQENNKTKSFEIVIDSRIELLSIFLSYSSWEYFGKFDDTTYIYYQKVKAHFDKFKDHP